MTQAHELRVWPDGEPPPVALVTGVGSPVGIGAAVCRRFAERGWAIAVSDRPEGVEGARTVAQELAGLDVEGALVLLDLNTPESPRKLVEEVERHLGRPPSILVNHAYHRTDDGFERLAPSSLDTHHSVNVRAGMLLATEVCRRKPAGRAGRIINLTSGQGAMPGELAYAASRGAIEAFTRSLAPEVAHHGITVNAVGPGATDIGRTDAGTKRSLLARSPMGRLGQPDDAARLVTFLASDDARWITGQVIQSDGALLRG